MRVGRLRVRKLTERRGWAVGFVASVLKPVLIPGTRRVWIDGTKIPATGGCVVVVNHNSHIDPLTTAHFVYDHGRIPRFLAKAVLFRISGIGRVITSAGQIPVERQSKAAMGAYGAAVQAIRRGACVVVYPEGTLTRDPMLWPMRGKSGAARIALETGCPVIPVGQWGAQEILPPYTKRPHLFPRKQITMKAGDPVDLSDLLELPRTPGVVNEATDRIMSAITAIVAELRAEAPPAVRFDPRGAGLREIGNPHPQGEA